MGVASLTLVSMSGPGWTCSTNTCTRSDPLNPGCGYAAIIVTVNVVLNAAAQVTNQVTGLRRWYAQRRRDRPHRRRRNSAAIELVAPRSASTEVRSLPDEGPPRAREKRWCSMTMASDRSLIAAAHDR
ncbi:MAG TPA: hypothetical protein VME43_09115, partial [Bryobacteraceae bacterium]|nr:hypothetical protein [Bryobacteraceae bacterium]